MCQRLSRGILITVIIKRCRSQTRVKSEERFLPLYLAIVYPKSLALLDSQRYCHLLKLFRNAPTKDNELKIAELLLGDKRFMDFVKK